MTSFTADFNMTIADGNTDGVSSGNSNSSNMTWLTFDFSPTNSSGYQTVDNHNSSDDAVATYLKTHLGLRHRNLVESVALTVVYCVILVTGVVGNVCTCLVVAINGHMHTTTNYYLFSLAVSDVLTLILGLPPELYTIWEAYPWRFGQTYCLFKTFLTEMTSSASILTISAFTIERYVAICHPLRAQTLSTLPRAVKIIVAMWVTACLTALPYPLHTRTFHYLDHPDHPGTPVADSLICSIPQAWQTRMRYFLQISTFLLFVLPVLLITCFYVLIGHKLHQSRAVGRSLGLQTGTGHVVDGVRVTSSSNNQLARNSSHGSSTGTRGTGSGRLAATSAPRKSIVKMLVAVVVAFVICWAPFHAQRLMTIYVAHWTDGLLEIQSLLFYISGILYFVSSTVNPILYNVMSVRYRKAFHDTLHSALQCRKSTRGDWSQFSHNALNDGGGTGPGAARQSHAIPRTVDGHRSPCLLTAESSYRCRSFSSAAAKRTSQQHSRLPVRAVRSAEGSNHRQGDRITIESSLQLQRGQETRSLCSPAGNKELPSTAREYSCVNSMESFVTDSHM